MSDDAPHALAEQPPPISPGTVVVERYEVEDVLGQGGFATVYKAFDRERHQHVAFKVLNVDPDLMDLETYRARFVREAQAAARIDHPNVVAIHDYGVAGPQRLPYVAMEMLEGHDLEMEIEQRGAVDPDRAMDLFLPALDALARGHEFGIIHRDLKPANLFIADPGTEDERLVLLDFGVAKLDDSTAVRLTATGQLFGTPAFAAPEWVRYQIATPALDVYQMGLILAEALTGEPIVDAENPFDCLNIHCQALIELPVDLLYGPLGEVFTKALALDHEQRYADASELRDALVDVDVGQLPKRISPGPRQRVTQPEGSDDVDSALMRPLSPDMFEDERPSSSSVSTPMIAAAAVIVAVIVGVIAWSFTRDEPPDATAAIVEQDGVSGAVSSEIVPEAASAAAVRGAVGALASDRLVTVTIESRPSGADVFDGKRHLGATPAEVHFEHASANARRLTLKLHGYEDTEVSVEPEDAPERVERLRRDRRRSTRDEDENDEPVMEILP